MRQINQRVRASLALAALCALGFGCAAQNADYCDQSQPCPTGKQCNLQTFSCQPTPQIDGGADGFSDKKPLGASCQSGARCQSGFCADGVCCAAACDGPCRSCDGAQPGVCKLVGAGKDPRGDCAGSVAACSGSCDGSGACSFPDETTSCGATGCTAGSLETKACDGAGDCSAKQALCDGFACAASGDACKQSCGGDADCSGTFRCVSGQCVNQLPQGAACGSNDKACASGHCVDGVCCGAASCGSCNRCDIAGSEGSCAPVADGQSCGASKCDSAALSLLTPTCSAGSCSDVAKSCGAYTCDGAATPSACRAACANDGDCAAGNYCDASTRCVAKKADGQGCDGATQCSSGHCVKQGGATSGVCCNRACGGAGSACESCNLPGKVGSCSFKPAGTLCGGADVCGDNATTRSSAVTRQQCSGSSASCAPATIACAAGAKCNAAKTACQASCTTHSQCWQGICDLWDIHNRKNRCAAPADTCHVSSGAAGSGSYAAPFGAIQKCLDSAKKYVRLSDGSYDESLVVKAPVALVAPTSPEGAFSGLVYTGKVIVNTPDSNPALLVDRDQIVGSNKRVLVYGVRFSRATASTAPFAVKVVATRADLYSVGAYDTTEACIYADSGGDLRVYDSAASGCKAGLYGFNGSVDARDTRAFLNSLYGIAVYGSGRSLSAVDVNAAFNGSGIAAFNAATVNIDRAFTDNNQKRGLYLSGGVDGGVSGTVTNLLAFNNGQHGVLLDGGANVDFGNVTVARNNGSGPDIACSGASARLVNSIVWDSVSGDASSGCSFQYSTIRTAPGVFTPPGTGNRSADPLFVDAANGNFTLQASSPCVDSGSDSGGSIGASVVRATDLTSASRKVKTGSGSASVDRGAYERQTP